MNKPSVFPAIGTHASRREFLKRSTAISAVAASATPLALNLFAMGEAAAQTASDYKAIVCIFLNGGNDYANTLVPFDAVTHSAYQKHRANIAYAMNQLTPGELKPSTALAGGVKYALPPELMPLLPIFNAGKLAPVLNVGTLIQPMTVSDYFAGKPRPPKLFSHNDQASFWQSSRAEGASSGWGGGMGGLMAGNNGNANFTCIGLGGNAVFLSGPGISQYQVLPANLAIGANQNQGAIGMAPITSGKLGGSTACADVFREILANGSGHLMETEYINVCKRSIDSHAVVARAVEGINLSTNFAKDLSSRHTGKPLGKSLAAQLRRVAELIAARSVLTAKRQVFMVSLGGFDNHADLKVNHSDLLQEVGYAMATFYAATQELKIENNVVTFTASDFGRTLASNASGSDHGWGSVQFVMGGAVKGGTFYGSSPEFGNQGANDVGQGRLVPTTGVDQLASTLASWFGVPMGQQSQFLPNVNNFPANKLQFMG